MSLNAKKLAAILGVTLSIFLVDCFYLNYITSHGFALKNYEFVLGTFKFSLPLQLFPVIGILLVSMVAWSEVSSTIFPRHTGLELDSLANIRLLRVIVFSLASFVCVLYVPYIVGSGWFWARMSSASSISQIRDLGLSLLNTDQSIMELDQLWQYSVSQAVALMAMILSAWMFGRGIRRVRK